MQCTASDCKGTVADGKCQICGLAYPSGGRVSQSTSANQQAITASVRALLEPADAEPTVDNLVRAAQSLEQVVADDYQAWRTQADILVSAIKNLEKRQIEPDESVKLIGVPLRESALRDAAEQALRNCAHFAETTDNRIDLIDEANRVRRTTWF